MNGPGLNLITATSSGAAHGGESERDVVARFYFNIYGIAMMDDGIKQKQQLQKNNYFRMGARICIMLLLCPVLLTAKLVEPI